MRYLILAITALFCFSTQAQDLTAEQLLDKAIEFHDPTGQWASFQGNFQIVMESPSSSARTTQLKIDLPNEYFQASASRDSVITNYIMDRGRCVITKADSVRIASLAKPPKRDHCEMTSLYKDYYTYLYGLPMKLKDPGTKLHPEVEKRSFKGKEYLVLSVSYEEAVGSDVWYFYFDPTSYAMEVYQFYKGDPNGPGKDTGEYILLSEMETVNAIKMPKKRAWYYNKDDGYLGTDILSQK